MSARCVCCGRRPAAAAYESGSRASIRLAPSLMESWTPRRGHGLFNTAGPIGRMSHGLCVVVTAPAGHGAPRPSRQLSARIISFSQPSSHPLPSASLRAAGEGRGEGALLATKQTRSCIRKNSAVNQRAAGLSPLSKKRSRLKASNVGERICHAKLSPAKTR